MKQQNFIAHFYSYSYESTILAFGYPTYVLGLFQK